MTSSEDLRMGSEARLWALIEERTRTGADLEAIDAHIWELFGEEWAVVFTDLSGFSRRTEEFGIIHFLQVIYESKQLLFPVIRRHRGFLVSSEADSLLLLFRRAETALRCAVDMQRACRAENRRRAREEQILLCVGAGAGRILRVGEHEVWGREVNAASKLGEDAAEPYEILVTGACARAAGSHDGLRFEPLEREVPGSPANHRLLYELDP